jgi:hypothetical protein
LGYSVGMNAVEYHRRETALKYAFEVGGVGAAAGLIGLAAGALAGSDKTIQLEGKSEAPIKSVLADLRSKARIRD